MRDRFFARCTVIVTVLSFFVFCRPAKGQEYVTPIQPTLIGRSPGVKIKLIAEAGETKTYVLVFAAGDEVLSGLKEFAIKFHVKSASFTGLGDISSVKFGWYNPLRKMLKVTDIKSTSEVTSLTGDIANYNNNPAVHAHITIAGEDGIARGGHLLEAFTEPSLEVIVTVYPVMLLRKPANEYGVTIIDPELK